jgi:hypothetical protein
MTYYAPQHHLRLFVVMEDFSGDTAAPVANAVDWMVTPRRAQLERNDIHTADKLTLDVDFRQYPFDPRMIRAASVAYYAWDRMGPPPVGPVRETLRFLGVVDEPQLVMGEDSHATLECRDYTAILLGKKAEAAMRVELGRHLDDILRDLLATLPGEQATLLTPVIYADGADWPVVSAGGRRSARLFVEPKDTLWGVIRRVVQMVGLVCWIDLDRLVVSTPRNITIATRPARFSFGRNLSDLRLRRNPQNLTKPVALTQFDTRTGTRSQAIYPPGAGTRTRGRSRAHATITSAGQGAATGEAATPEEFNITDSLSAEDLALAAERIYRDRARVEVEGSFTTHEMRVGGYDLLAAKTTDAIEAVVDEQVRTIVTRSGADRILSELALRDLGYPPEVARALVRGWEALDRVRVPFVVRKAALQIDDSGFQADIDFQNALTPFIEADIPADAASTRTRSP